MNELTSFNPSNYLNTSPSPFQIDCGNSFEYIRFINNSPYLLRINLGGQGTFVFPENYLEDIAISRQFNGQIQIVGYSNFPGSAISSALSSVVSINTYVPGELLQPQAQPITTLAAVGGGALSQNQTLVNIGQPNPTQIVISTPNSSFAVVNHLPQTNLNNNGTFGIGDNGSQSLGHILTSDGLGTLGCKVVQANTGVGFPPNISTFQGQAPVLLQTGNQETGKCGGNYSNCTNGQAVGPVVNFKCVMTNAPSSITFSNVNQVNAGAASSSLIDVYGFNMFWSASGAAGTVSEQIANYTTVGN